MKPDSILAQDILERFLRYAAVDTMSDEHLASTIHPSTPGQMVLLSMLERELKEFGVKDVTLTETGYLIARIPATVTDAPTIGFMAHVDTADDVYGNGVKPQVIESYDGNDIILQEGRILAKNTPEISQYIGQTIITSDGTTLLGADDKAGVAELMAVAKLLAENKSYKHGLVEFIFTCDEETGFGMDFFPYDLLKSTCCYTLDGGKRFEIETECFNAATVKIRFTGIAAHLGAARGIMVNALTMAASYLRSLPQAESPEATDGRYGYYCAQEMKGNATEAEMTVYVRDFDAANFQRRLEVLQQLGKMIEALYPGGTCEVAHKISYYNMAGSAKDNPEVIEAIYNAGKKLGMPLTEEIIRGGTDGARLAEKGIPAPNIFAGGHNLHSYYEWAALAAMEDAAKLTLGIIEYWGEQK